MTQPATCAHHWVIEAANGPKSNGVCQRCGAERVFDNTVNGTNWTSGWQSQNQREQTIETTEEPTYDEEEEE